MNRAYNLSGLTVPLSANQMASKAAQKSARLPVSPRMGGRKVTVELRDELAWVGSYHCVNLLTATE